MTNQETQNPLVSIITPCYNAEQTIGRLIESVMDQTYRPIEHIIVNDGSTDQSGKVIDSYIDRAADCGIKLIQYRQENKGLGGAIDTGLKLFSGQYLCWPDADDYLEKESVEKRVCFLEGHPDYGVVTSNAYVRESTDLQHYRLLTSADVKRNQEPYQFRLLINGDSIFCPGCHMARTSAFLDVNPDRSIYPARRGQNWQILLPLYYKYKRGYIDTPLYNYVVYSNSMSHGDDTEQKKLIRYEEHEKILRNTLSMIEKNQHVDLHEFYCLISDKYAKLRMEIAIQYNDKALFNRLYLDKQNTVGFDRKDNLLYWRNKSRMLNKAIDKIRQCKKRMRK